MKIKYLRKVVLMSAAIIPITTVISCENSANLESKFENLLKEKAGIENKKIDEIFQILQDIKQNKFYIHIDTIDSFLSANNIDLNIFIKYSDNLVNKKIIFNYYEVDELNEDIKEDTVIKQLSFTIPEDQEKDESTLVETLKSKIEEIEQAKNSIKNQIKEQIRKELKSNAVKTIFNNDFYNFLSDDLQKKLQNNKLDLIVAAGNSHQIKLQIPKNANSKKFIKIHSFQLENIEENKNFENIIISERDLFINYFGPYFYLNKDWIINNDINQIFKKALAVEKQKPQNQQADTITFDVDSTFDFQNESLLNLTEIIAEEKLIMNLKYFKTETKSDNTKLKLVSSLNAKITSIPNSENKFTARFTISIKNIDVDSIDFVDIKIISPFTVNNQMSNYDINIIPKTGE